MIFLERGIAHFDPPFCEIVDPRFFPGLLPVGIARTLKDGNTVMHARDDQVSRRCTQTNDGHGAQTVPEQQDRGTLAGLINFLLQSFFS